MVIDDVVLTIAVNVACWGLLFIWFRLAKHMIIGYYKMLMGGHGD